MLTPYLQQITFEWPWVLLLIPMIILIAVVRPSMGKIIRTIKVSHLPAKGLPATWRTQTRKLPSSLFLTAACLLFVALARPVSYQTIEQHTGNGIDIMLCLDVSGSMLARDFVPDRLSASLTVAKNFVDQRKGDRIGVVIFAGKSFTLCPLTTDHAAVLSQLSQIDYGMLADGTSIGSGLASAADRLSAEKSATRIIVLLTDGEDTGGLMDPKTALQIAIALGIKVYTIGVGTVGIAPMPYKNGTGGTVLQNEKVSIDEALLLEIANKTGGNYYRATNADSLAAIYNTINQLEKSKVQTKVFRKKTYEMYGWVMAASMVALLAWVLQQSIYRQLP